MKHKNENNHIIDILFTLALFCVFAASALFVVLIGANVYKSTVTQMNDNFSTRTSLSYVSEKIRQNDTKGAVSITDLEGTPALLLSQKYDNIFLETYIYEQNGSLMELFIQGDQVPQKDDGQSIMEVDSFEMEQINDHLFHFISADTNGHEMEIYISPKSIGGDS